MTKVLWFDTETTGVDPVKNDIIQIAGIVEIDGQEAERFEFKCLPRPGSIIEESALKVNNRTMEEIQNWPDPTEVYRKLLSIFSRYVDKYDKRDKMIPAGHVVSFDVQMLAAFFKKSGDQYGIGSYMIWQPLDTMYIGVLSKRLGIIDPINLKLSELCSLFNVKNEQAHDAFGDIVASRNLYYSMIESIKKHLMSTQELFHIDTGIKDGGAVEIGSDSVQV